MSRALVARLASIVGSTHCLEGADRGPFVVEGRTPSAVVFPGTVEEAAAVVSAAADAGMAVIPWGGGTKAGLGAPPCEGAVVVVTRRLARVLEHEPADLTATVQVGITVAALQTALGTHGQWASFDPPLPAQATLGGVLAADASGPRRYLYGTARDLVIGLRVVGPDGVPVRCGGKVVKNVAGYDLAKLYIGSLGTLGLIVEATLKLRPRPEADRGCWAAFRDLETAGAAVRSVTGSDLIPHSIELLDPGAAALAGVALGLPAGPGPVLLVAFDGLATTVAWQLAEAERLLRGAGARDLVPLDDAAAARAVAFGRDIQTAVAEPVARAAAGVLPAQSARYLAAAGRAVREAGLGLVAAARAGSGVCALVLSAGEGAARGGTRTVKVLERLRAEARELGGHFLLEWAPLAVKEEVAAWDPPGPAVRLMERIKAQLDPKRVMNPGRFVGGI